MAADFRSGQLEACRGRSATWRRVLASYGAGSPIERCCRDLAPGYHVSRWPAKSAAERPGPVIREELTRLFTWEERHRRLAARLLIAFGLTLLVLAVGSVLIWLFESGVKGGDIHGYGDAVFFTAVQLLTISSAITNPLTTGGKVVDVALEMWAIFVVTGVAGSFASFFTSGDSS
jgi:hypothetical protein